ncbi:MAG: rhomboid family intramembrane serine protease [Dysgonamonadaceae bacterium]|jgi:rhomboid protease GluP|nr:rhomboid family intramembrane serine protease [Dysgonamonadaceae bacterium]
MALGFLPKHVMQYSLDGLDNDHFLVIAFEAVSKLGWNVSLISETGLTAYTKISLSSYSEEITVKIDNGIAHLKSECTGNQIIDWGKNKRNIEKFTSVFEEIKETFTAEEIEQKLNELKQSYEPKEDDISNAPPLTVKNKITGIFSIFKPSEDYFITPVLINLNVLVFIIMLFSGVDFFSPSKQSLLDWGANFRPLTLDGQWWRLFTACFLHIGIIHLLLNMYALLYIGVLLEPCLGKARFLTAYLLSGIVASSISLWWHDLTISAGASGAIFGMYGVFLALLTTNIIDKYVKKIFLTSIIIFVAYNILYGLKSNEGIDNAAHIGGLVSGLIIGYAFVPSLKKFNSFRLKLSVIGILAVAMFTLSFSIYKTLPNDVAEYEAKMKVFVAQESMALEVFNLNEPSNEEILSELKNRGLYFWNENLELLKSCDDLDLPQVIIIQKEKLKEYCLLRIKSYELIYKSIEEDTDQYDNMIDDYLMKIENIINELTGSDNQ